MSTIAKQKTLNNSN